MQSKKINELGTNVSPSVNDLTVIGDAATGQLKKITLSQISGLFGSSGTVSSVAMTVPTGLTVTGSPITTSGTLAVSLTAGYSIPTTAKQTDWDTAFIDRNKWDGGTSGLNAATARTSLGLVIGTDVLAYRTFGSAANNNTGDFATAAQGTNADTAYNLRLTGASAPLSISGNVISISQANTTTNGFLTSADWNTFNGKQNSLTLTTTGSSGAATLVGSTLNIPNYTPDLSGYVTIGTTQTITGTKTFDGASRQESGILLKNGVLSGLTGYTSLAGAMNGLVIQLTGSSNQQTLIFQSASAYSYTLPATSGTIALTSNISYPVTSVFGRTGAVVAASGDYTTTQVTEGTNLYYTNARARGAISLTTTGSSGAATYNSTTGVFNIPNYAPDLSGYVTIGTTQTITGNKTFNEATRQDSGLLLKNGVLAGATGYASLGGASNGLVIQLSGSSSQQTLIFQSASAYTYTLPAATGTIALTSNLSSYVPTSRTLNINGTSFDLSADRTYSINVGVTSVTGTSPIVSSGGATPAISITQASSTTSGYLSSTDWNTFNNAATGSYLPLSGGTVSGNVIINGSTNLPLKITGTEPYMEVQANGSTNVCGIKFLPSTGYDAYIGNYGSGKLWLISGNADNTYVAQDGSLYNTTGTYGTISDITLKENIVDTTPKLQDILKLKVRNFNFIGNDKKQLGFIAQEFEEVFPNAVDTDTSHGEHYGKKVVKTTVLIPMLVKVVQEQNQVITNLTDRINKLEQLLNK